MKKDKQGFEYKDLEINHPAVKESRIYNFAMTKEQMLKLQKENDEKN